MDAKKFMRDEIKKHSGKRLINSVRYAVDGLKSGFKLEQNMTLQVIISLCVIILGLIVGLSRIEWIISILMIGLVMGTELVNTSIEAVLDVLRPDINPITKIAKDTSAAAVLVFCVMSGIIGLLIFIPHIIKLIQKFI